LLLLLALLEAGVTVTNKIGVSNSGGTNMGGRVIVVTAGMHALPPTSTS